MVRVKDVFFENREEKENIYIHLNDEKQDEFDPLTVTLWEGWLKDIPDEYMNYEVIHTGQSLADMEKGITGFHIEIRSTENVESGHTNLIKRTMTDAGNLFRAKTASLKKWVEGSLVVFDEEHQMIVPVHYSPAYTYSQLVERNAMSIVPNTVCRCVGKEYMNAEMAFEGDIFESQVCGVIMVIRYGLYQAYCPADRCCMDSVGFYAEAPGYPQMPIGDLSDYALKVGNVFDNPELLERLKE